MVSLLHLVDLKRITKLLSAKICLKIFEGSKKRNASSKDTIDVTNKVTTLAPYPAGTSFIHIKIKKLVKEIAENILPMIMLIALLKFMRKYPLCYFMMLSLTIQKVVRVETLTTLFFTMFIMQILDFLYL